MRMLPTILILATLSACSYLPQVQRRAQPEAPLPYSADLSVARGSPDVIVAVQAGGADLATFRESARYPATRYCLQWFGTSDVRWVLDPATTDWQVARDTTGRTIVRGTCGDR